IRTNISNERFEGSSIDSDETSPEAEIAAVSSVLDLVAPERRARVLEILSALQGTRGALEGIAFDFEGDAADIKLYFLPRHQQGGLDSYSDAETTEFIDTALEMFGLQRHR